MWKFEFPGAQHLAIEYPNPWGFHCGTQMFGIREEPHVSHCPWFEGNGAVMSDSTLIPGSIHTGPRRSRGWSMKGQGPWEDEGLTWTAWEAEPVLGSGPGACILWSQCLATPVTSPPSQAGLSLCRAHAPSFSLTQPLGSGHPLKQPASCLSLPF